MKIFFSSAIILSLCIIVSSCGNGKHPGRVYMPDMAYSRALETYSQLDSSRFTSDTNAKGKGKIFFNARPVIGTIAMNDEIPFQYAMDRTGDSTNYIASKQVKNPYPALNDVEMKEAERLYLVNCAICHGPKLDGNGPLFASGKYPAAPRNLITYILPEGQMFFSITYGKNAMGSYASQISTHQRWMIIDYIKSKQVPAGKDSAAVKGATNTAAVKDTTATKK